MSKENQRPCDKCGSKKFAVIICDVVMCAICGLKYMKGIE